MIPFTRRITLAACVAGAIFIAPAVVSVAPAEAQRSAEPDVPSVTEAAPIGPADLAATLVNSTTPGALTAYSTLISAGFEWLITGDDNNNCAVTLEYRMLGSTIWKPAQPLLRVEHGIWTHGEDPGNMLAGSLFFLNPGTTYEARLTLSDPDGGSDQRVVTFTTRTEPQATAARTLYVIPGSGGGTGSQTDPFRGLAAADAAAQAGDLFIVLPGTYHGAFRPAHDGGPGRPIAYRGANANTVILDGDGGTSSTSNCVDLTSRQYVIIENMTLIDCLRPLVADNSVGVTIRRCTIQPINQLLSIQAIHAATCRDLFIADNTITMTGQWATIGRTGTYGTGGYAILIEGTGHVVCHNSITEAWDAISIPVTGTAVPACITSNVDIYENYVDRASDDGIQADATQHNVRIFRNRLLNTGSGISFQPAFGGPGYVLYNELYNNRIEPYKFHQETFYGWTQETSGFIVYHNTEVCNRNAWYESGIWRHGRFRNNLLIGARVSVPSFQTGTTMSGADFDYDAFNRVNGYSTLVRYGSVSYSDLPAFYSGMGFEHHGAEVPTTTFVNAPLPHNPEWNYTDGYGWAYKPSDFDLRLASNSSAIDRAQVLANINDGYTGAAPDLGCYELGAALPVYGPRPDQTTSSPIDAGESAAMLTSEPNPFIGSTSLSFALPERSPVNLSVYDLQGARVATLVEGSLPAGAHHVVWNARARDGHRIASGVYFIRLEADRVRLTRRIVLMK
jgi:hypothetical protein